MRIGIDISPLKSGHKTRGIGFYTKRLIEALKKTASGKNFDFEFVESADKLLFVDVDLIHYPYFSPFFLSLPAKPLVPSVVTIHDLTPVMYMEHFLPGVKGKARWLIQKRRLKKIQAVITDSQYWQEEIPHLTGYPQEKIYSIPLAAGEEFGLIKEKEVFARVKKKYQLPGKYILYVGDVNWNKNVAGLIKAFSIFNFHPPAGGFKLVLVGKAFEQKDLPETKALLRLIKSEKLTEKVKLLGYVPTEDLVAIYNLASVCCQPSFCEGFGLPVLEAMACGCPVVAAKTSSLPEICGEAAVLVDPDDINSIGEGIKRAWVKRAELRELGFKQVQNYSWQKTAQETVKVYEKVYQ